MICNNGRDHIDRDEKRQIVIHYYFLGFKRTDSNDDDPYQQFQLLDTTKLGSFKYDKEKITFIPVFNKNKKFN
jgi:hypothetical protein